MSRNRALLSFISFLTVLTVAGCGGGVQTSQPNPSGFNNGSLNGTYVFAISGTNANGFFFAAAGTFTANGNGSITSGVEDFNSPNFIGVAANIPITGNYAVRADGRTTVTITSSSLANFNFGMDFVLLSSQKGLAIEFDQNGTASGTVDLVNSGATNLSALAGSFVFNTAGSDINGAPENFAGVVTFDASGNISTGVADDNDVFSVNGGGGIGVPASITAASAAFSSPTNGRGTATITTSGSFATVRNFAYYPIDTNHLKVVEIDGTSLLAGDAFRQSTSPVSGNFVFTMAGNTAVGHQFFLAGGILVTDGAGNIISGSTEDLDDGGQVTALGGAGFTGTYAPVTAGRGTIVLNGFIPQNLAYYPSTGGLQLIDLDSGQLLASGTALPQSGGPFSTSSINNGFGLNFTGVLGPTSGAATEIDAVAQFNSTGSGTISGALDSNNFGALTNSLSLNGSYTVAANGRGTAALKTSQSNLNLIFYMASNSQVVFVELDESFGQLTVGSFASQ